MPIRPDHGGCATVCAIDDAISVLGSLIERMRSESLVWFHGGAHRAAGHRSRGEPTALKPDDGETRREGRMHERGSAESLLADAAHRCRVRSGQISRAALRPDGAASMASAFGT